MTAPTIPSDADSLEELLTDSARMQEVFGDQQQLKDFMRNYVAAHTKRDPDVSAQIREQLQLEWANFLKDHEQDLVRPSMAPNVASKRAAAYNALAPGAALDAEFATTGEYLSTIWHRNYHPAAAEKRARLRNDYSTQVPSDGGFLVPETLRSQLLQVSLETSIVRPRAMVIPMETARVPFPTLDSTTNSGSVFGGMVAYWTEESGTLTESEARFGRVVLDAKKLTGYSEAPNELFSDSIISFEAFLTQKWPEALAFFEDIAFVSGSGVGQPLGFMNASAAVSVTKETGQAAGTIVWENIVKAYSRMLPTSLGKAIWLAHIDTFPELATMALSVGTGGSAIWLNNGAVGPPMTILGRPVVFSEKCSTVGTAGDVNFVDLSYYLIGDRQTMQMDTSPHYKFANDQTAVRIIQRVDGRPWIQSAITPQTGSNTLSPFVKIATRA